MPCVSQQHNSPQCLLIGLLLVSCVLVVNVLIYCKRYASMRLVAKIIVSFMDYCTFLNQACAWFLEITFTARVYACVCVCVHPRGYK